jgi:hypothetical protein
MTFEVEWPPEVVESVKYEVQAWGLTVDVYLLQVAFPI